MNGGMETITEESVWCEINNFSIFTEVSAKIKSFSFTFY